MHEVSVLSVTVRCGQHNVCIVHEQGNFYGNLAKKNVYYMVLTEIHLSFNVGLTIQLYGWNAERKLNKAEQILHRIASS